MQSAFVDDYYLDVILRLLTYPNALACCVSLETGLRISDVLSLPSTVLEKDSFTIREQKTGKSKRVKLRKELRSALTEISGKYYVFPHRFDEHKHRTRQAVYQDVKRACKALRLKAQISPHSMRKVYAVELYKRKGDIKAVQKALNHTDELTTLLYALADYQRNSVHIPQRAAHKR